MDSVVIAEIIIIVLMSWTESYDIYTFSGELCVFPFKYRGELWSTCIEADTPSGILWCATTPDYDADLQWGYCKIKVRTFDAIQSMCTFPFQLGKDLFFRCYYNDDLQFDGQLLLQGTPFCLINDVTVAYCMRPDKAESMPDSPTDLTFFNSEEPISEIELASEGLYGSCIVQPYDIDGGLTPENNIYFGCHHSSNDNDGEPTCYTSYNKTEGRFTKRGRCINHALYGKAYAINVAREAGWNFEARNIIDGWANPNPAFNTCLATEQVMKPWYMVMLPYVISVSNISIQNNNLDTQDPWSALLQNEFTIYVLDVIKLTAGVVNVDLIKDGICANVTNGLSPGGSTSYSQTFSCDQIGRLVVVSGYSTDPQSLSICEIAIYGKYIGEVAGMSLYPNIFTGIFRSVEVPVFLNGTVLFKGDQLRVLEEGILMGWKYLLGAEGTVCLQIWRPVEYNPTEYRLLYSKLVSGKPGSYWLDVSSEHFPVYHDDLVGVSFLGGPPVPLYGIYNCEYFTVGGRLVVGDMVYYNEDYITELDRVATFTEYTICLDYFIQAIVRYNACQVHTCINGGTCIEKWDAQPQNSFECQCLPGYRGTYCQHNIDMCRNNTCLNGGTCVDDILLLTRCVCTEGFTGKMCEIPTESASSTESEEDDTETEAMTVTVTEFLTKADVLSLPIVTCDGGHGKFVLVPTEFGVSEGSMSCYYRRSTTHCASLCLQMTYTCNVYLFSELSGECCTLKTGELYHVKQGEFQTYYLIGCV